MPHPPITIDSHDPDIVLYVRDEPGPGGAHHHYTASVMGRPTQRIDEHGHPFITRKPVLHVDVIFQRGGKNEPVDGEPGATIGANGITNEVLLEIVRHRLSGFQAGAFACKENESALSHVEDAIEWLLRRTKKRLRRGVEGKEVR